MATAEKIEAGALAPVFELPSHREPRLRRLEAESRTAMADLLPAERAFVRYICSAIRPGEAAVRAGYQKSTGYQLVKNPRIQRAISIVTEWADLAAGVDPAWVRKKLRDVIELAHIRRELKTEIGALRLLSELAGLIQGKAPVAVETAPGNVNIQINIGPAKPRELEAEAPAPRLPDSRAQVSMLDPVTVGGRSVPMPGGGSQEEIDPLS
jgi:hypothetical protein